MKQNATMGAVAGQPVKEKRARSTQGAVRDGTDLVTPDVQTSGFIAASLAFPVWSLPIAVGPVTSGGTWLALLGQLPDPKSSEAMGWVLLILGGFVTLIGGILAVLLTAVTLWSRIRGKTVLENPVVIEHSGAGPGRIEFDAHVKGLDELKAQRRIDVDGINSNIAKVSEKLDKFSSDNYKRRRAMHREINTQREAMAYMAGEMAGRNPAGAEALRALIAPKTDGGEAENQD